MNQDDQASDWQEEIETTPDFLAELKDKARQRGLSLFAYLAHFVSQDNEARTNGFLRDNLSPMTFFSRICQVQPLLHSRLSLPTNLIQPKWI